MNLLVSMRYLVALDEHKHFARAAQACFVTQPALSNALRALEQEFGSSIVKRGRTFVGFTPEGERLLQSARRMLREEQLLKQDQRADRAVDLVEAAEFRRLEQGAHAAEHLLVAVDDAVALFAFQRANGSEGGQWRGLAPPHGGVAFDMQCVRCHCWTSA